MANTTVSKVDSFPIPKAVRAAAEILSGKYKDYAASLSTKVMQTKIALIEKTWIAFRDDTKGTKIQFTRRLDSSCPDHKKDVTQEDGTIIKGYPSHPMYNAVVNATTRAVGSGKSGSSVGHTSEDGTLDRLFQVQCKRFPTYTPEEYEFDLRATERLTPKVAKNINGFIEGTFTPPDVETLQAALKTLTAIVKAAMTAEDETEEEEAEIEAELAATG